MCCVFVFTIMIVDCAVMRPSIPGPERGCDGVPIYPKILDEWNKIAWVFVKGESMFVRESRIMI